MQEGARMNDASVLQSVEGEFHEPSDEAFACLPRLEIHRPVLVGDSDSKRAWNELRSSRRALGQAMQRAIGDIVVHVRDLRAAGKVRFPTPAERLNEKTGVPLPTDCYEVADTKRFQALLNDGLKRSGLSEYVYSSVARRVGNSELSGEKLKALLRGDAAYPHMQSVDVMMRSRNWKLAVQDRVANGKTYLDVTVEIAALRPGLGKMRIACKGWHGPKIGRWRKLLQAIHEMEEQTEHKGYSKGALTIMLVRRPGQPDKWFLSLPYSAPRAVAGEEGPVLAVHRSVAAMLTAISSDGDTHQFMGRDIVALKNQMYARKRKIQRDLSAMPHRGRGAKYHFKALKRLSDAEYRATQTNLWRAARWVQATAERLGARLVLLDDFGSFDPDLPAPPFEPYVRRFPLADLKLKIVDALTRRAGIPVQEVPSRYLSQKCPSCGHVDEKNVAKMPVARWADVEKGWFKCTKCRFSTDVDVSAAMNMLKDSGISPPAKRSAAR